LTFTNVSSTYQRRPALPYVATQVFGKQRCETLFPLPYRFVREFEAAQQEHLSQVPQAQLIPQSPQHNLKYYVGREFQMIEQTTSSLVEPTLATAAAKDGITDR
jgi:hypothetical protein